MQAFEREGKKIRARHRALFALLARPESPFRSLLNACQAGYRRSRKGAWPNVVQSQSSGEIRNA